MLFHDISCIFTLMQCRLLLFGAPADPPGAVAVSVDELVDPTVGDVLGALGLLVDGAYVDGRRVDPAEAALEVFVAGSTVAAWAGRAVPSAVPVVGLAVVAGPDAGQIAHLGVGAHVVGRDLSSAVAVEDRTVSRRHIEIQATDAAVTTRDLGSVNGSRIGDTWIVTASAVMPKALIHVGASSLRFHALPGPSSPPIGPARGGHIAFVRPPRQQLPAAQPIAPPPRAHGASRRLAIDVVAIAVPVLFALLLAVAFDPRFALMGLIGPVLAISNHFGQRRRARRDDAQREITERQARTRFGNDLLAARVAHTRDLHERAPDLGEIARRIEGELTGLWERRPAHDDFLALTVGFAAIDWTPAF